MCTNIIQCVFNTYTICRPKIYNMCTILIRCLFNICTLWTNHVCNTCTVCVQYLYNAHTEMRVAVSYWIHVETKWAEIDNYGVHVWYKHCTSLMHIVSNFDRYGEHTWYIVCTFLIHSVYIFDTYCIHIWYIIRLPCFLGQNQWFCAKALVIM